MSIAMVDRHKDDVLRKDINLKMVKPDAHEGRLIPTVFIHFAKFPFSYPPALVWSKRKS
jgi:hypothetical protein